MQAIEQVVRIMAQLRDPDRGCPWDVAQDFRSIAPHTLEEAYEVVDAIERDAGPDALRDELGDLLLQVIYHTRMAEEQGWFALDDVAEALRSKLVRRHPHVFGEAAAAAEMPDGAWNASDPTGAAPSITETGAHGGGSEERADGQPRAWEAIKAAERAARQGAGARDEGALAGVATALPALTRARKLQARAARAGFDWPDADGPRAKVMEELREIDDAVEQGAPAAIEGEVGDLLFACVNYARHLGVEPEKALRGTIHRFETRYRALEHDLEARGLDAADQPIEVLEAAWQRAKKAVGSGGSTGGASAGK